MTLVLPSMRDIELEGMRVLIREDFNVPVVAGKVTNTARIKAALPTIKFILGKARQICFMSHLGRPSGIEPEFSLYPVINVLQEMLEIPVHFSKTLTSSIEPLVLYENVRFFPGESTNDLSLAKKMADLCDVFVMDAFGSAHRAHASTVGVIENAPQAVAGLLLENEISNLDRVMVNPAHPLVAVIGGSKISSKMQVISSLLHRVDKLIIGGGMANTFLAAIGHDIKNSLFEQDMLDFAINIMQGDMAAKIALPTDMVWQDDKIMDIGDKSCANFADIISNAKTVLWNGPMGVFEEPRFANGTVQVAKSIASSDAYSIAGGGDTLAALETARISDGIDYISTGGGAFLEYIEKGTLPAIQALTRKVVHGIKTH